MICAGALTAAGLAAIAPASAQDLPNFDINAYCAQVAAAGGGSYMIEQGCREQEAAAQAELASRTIEPRILEYCTQVAQVSGGSYGILQGCVQMEERARDQIN
jgi:hypothetical protein